jgi:hypothetical protein
VSLSSPARQRPAHHVPRWESNRNNSSTVGWICDKSGSVTSTGTGYTLCHRSDAGSSGQWRFFNFNVDSGPLSVFNGKVDLKAFLDGVTKTYSGFTSDMWLTRIHHNTAGSTNIRNLTFEINGTSKSVQLAK